MNVTYKPPTRRKKKSLSATDLRLEFYVKFLINVADRVLHQQFCTMSMQGAQVSQAHGKGSLLHERSAVYSKLSTLQKMLHLPYRIQRQYCQKESFHDFFTKSQSPGDLLDKESLTCMVVRTIALNYILPLIKVPQVFPPYRGMPSKRNLARRKIDSPLLCCGKSSSKVRYAAIRTMDGFVVSLPVREFSLQMKTR